MPRSSPLRISWFKIHPLLCFAILSVLWVAVLYRNALSAGFVYDDIDQIQHNVALRSWPAILQYFGSADHFSGSFRGAGGTFYRPLFWTTLVIDWHLWKLHPAGFHLTNLALHWVNGLLAFLLLRRLRASLLLAGSAVFLWLGLPILSESVAWISGRPYLLTTLFLLVSLHAAEWYCDSRRTFALFCFAAASLAALLSHEAGILVLPFVVLAGLVRERLRASTAPLLLAGLAAVVIDSLLRQRAGAFAPLSLEILPVGASLLKYVAWMALPLHMSVERSTDTPANAFSLAAVGSLVFVAVVIAAVIWWRKRVPEAAAALAWTGVALLPFAGVVPLYQGLAERYTYIASLGFVFALVAMAGRAPARSRVYCGAILAAWTLWGAWRLDARVLDWRNESALYSSSLQTNPRSPILLYNLGAIAERMGEFDKAESFYRQALSYNPRYAPPIAGLGNLRFDRGDLAEAAALYDRARTLDPQYGAALGGLANVHLAQGAVPQAIQEYKQAVLLDPSDITLRVNLGAALQRAGDLAGAENSCRLAISMDPFQDRPYSSLGAVLLQQGRLDEALANFQTAVGINPVNRSAYLNMASIYRRKGDVATAAKMVLKAEQSTADYRTRSFTLEPQTPR